MYSIKIRSVVNLDSFYDVLIPTPITRCKDHRTPGRKRKPGIYVYVKFFQKYLLKLSCKNPIVAGNQKGKVPKIIHDC